MRGRVALSGNLYGDSRRSHHIYQEVQRHRGRGQVSRRAGAESRLLDFVVPCDGYNHGSAGHRPTGPGRLDSQAPSMTIRLMDTARFTRRSTSPRLNRCGWQWHFRWRRAGWPLIFAFVYDMFWKVGRAAKLRAFVSWLIGSEYQPTISFWGQPRSGGPWWIWFPPHMDDVRPGHHTVTCWVPLTPVTPDNGCVYVIERNAANSSDP